MATLSKKVGKMEFDGLVSGLTPEVQIGAGTIRKLGTAGTIKRGTLMAISNKDNKLIILGSSAEEGSQKFSGDASTTTFTVTAKPTTVTSAKVGTSDAVISDYNPYTGVVTLSSAPVSGTDNVVITYPDEILTPNCIITDDIDVGTSADVNAAVYTAGCFDSQKVTVKSGYTITASDKDTLRKYDIVFKDASAEI